MAGEIEENGFTFENLLKGIEPILEDNMKTVLQSWNSHRRKYLSSWQEFTILKTVNSASEAKSNYQQLKVCKVSVEQVISDICSQTPLSSAIGKQWDGGAEKAKIEEYESTITKLSEIVSSTYESAIKNQIEIERILDNTKQSDMGEVVSNINEIGLPVDDNDPLEDFTMAYLKRNFSSHVNALDDRQFKSRVRQSLSAARSFGLTKTNQIITWVIAMFIVGPHFDQFPPIKHYLGMPGNPNTVFGRLKYLVGNSTWVDAKKNCAKEW